EGGVPCLTWNAPALASRPKPSSTASTSPSTPTATTTTAKRPSATGLASAGRSAWPDPIPLSIHECAAAVGVAARGEKHECRHRYFPGPEPEHSSPC